MHNTETKPEKTPKNVKKPPKIREIPELIDLNSELSEKEIKVLDAYFSGHPLHKAVKAAGYKAKDASTRVFIGNRILQKYEGQAGGKEIFRRIGLGEVRIALKLLALTEDENPRVRLQALNIASKCVGMQREVLESLEAPIIVIGGQEEGEVQAQQEQLRAQVQGQGRGRELGQVVPMEITK
ncbi:MAG: hypothetical protein QME75_10640 [Deltaproteobacteria bacterium]|nr:hypothetical protein [Deltaproteobacteria bacterium]